MKGRMSLIILLSLVTGLGVSGLVSSLCQQTKYGQAILMAVLFLLIVVCLNVWAWKQLRKEQGSDNQPE